jgi:diamine N-acetyltransferase
MASTIELREITKDSLAAVLDLAVEPEQEQYVATNARSIAEAHFEPHAWCRAVYADDIPVGFVMAYRDPPKTFWGLALHDRCRSPGQGLWPPGAGGARRRGAQGRRRRGEAQLPRR